MTSNMKKWTMVVNEFVQICQRYRVPAPEFEYSTDGEYTDPEVVRLTPDADPRHVFGHYLIDLHHKEPDIVADCIKDMIINNERFLSVRGLDYFDRSDFKWWTKWLDPVKNEKERISD